MKWAVLLRAVATATAVINYGFAATVLEAPAPAQAGAPGPAPSPAQPSLETLHIKFEIMNFNYYDLTKETCPEKVIKKRPRRTEPAPVEASKDDDKADEKAPSDSPPAKDSKGSRVTLPSPPKVTAPDADVDVDGAIDEMHTNTESITKQIQKGLGNFGTKEKPPKPPWMDKKKKKEDAKGAEKKKKGAEVGDSFLQVGSCIASEASGETTSTECTTIMDVLRDTIKETIQGIIKCLYLRHLAGPAPAPAPMMPPVPLAGLLPAAPSPAKMSFLHLKPSGPGPAPAPGPSGPQIPDVKVFVTFSPGRKVGNGRSTIVHVAFLDAAGNGLDDVAAVKPFLVWCDEAGVFHNELKKSLAVVTDIKPKIQKMQVITETIEQWSIGKCETHIKDLVDEFSLHYTRAQVPMALYNECTNFMTKMSFSHDYVLDPMDTVRCKRATRKFERRWNYGKNAEEKDFEGMCFHACEAKYGRNAPTCNIHAGDGLLNQPLL